MKNMRNIVLAGVFGVFGFLGLFLSPMLVENMNASEYIVVQSPVSGELTWYTGNGGWKWQGFGSVTSYPRREKYDFVQKVRFNDGGHADMNGSIQYELPVDVAHLNVIHTQFHSPEAVRNALIETVVNKSIYMTGPLMSSKESYSEKRNSLIHAVEDQVANGVYQTVQKEVKVRDAITSEEKTSTMVEILMGKDGLPLRQEASVLTLYGIRTSNFSISEIAYEAAVENQIQQQQKVTMDVQLAIADAKKAEQRAITVAKQGEADAAKAKWEQEVLKAKAVTQAQQELEVAALDAKKALTVAEMDAKTAAQEKSAKILRAEGESEYKRKIMVADGALAQKLETYLETQKVWANAIQNYQGNLVPQFSFGGSSMSGNAGNTSQNLVELLTAKTAKDLALDMNVNKTSTSQK